MAASSVILLVASFLHSSWQPCRYAENLTPLRVINIKDAVMNISGINSSNSFAFPSIEKEENAAPTALSHDVVSLSAPNLLADDEVDGVMSDTMDMISQNPMSALSVHSGLSASRVAALLSM
jgi:hypothetical protein